MNLHRQAKTALPEPADPPGDSVDSSGRTLHVQSRLAATLKPEDGALDHALATWDILTQHLEAFLAAWEQGRVPAIADHLPEAPPLVRKLALVELVKADLEMRFGRGERKLLEEYCREHVEIDDPAGPPCELIYEEFHVRRANGDNVSPHDYYERFPLRRRELERLLGLGDKSQTTSLFGQRRPIDLKEGDQIDDFQLLSRLGQGAFGAVYLARQRSISRLVALKVSADRGQEARTLAQLDHPNIVRVYDQRRLPEQKLRLVYMQLAPGGTLAEVIARIREVPPGDRHGKHLVEVLQEQTEQAGLGPMGDPKVLDSLAQMSWTEVVFRIGMQLAQALDYAHRQGVLHRDVKPANILLSGDGTPKLADFNISSLASNPGVGAAAYFGGSLAYMSPEHLEAFNARHDRKADELDERADLYSLAVVLWELLCGQKPFRDVHAPGDFYDTLDGMTERRRQKQLEPPSAPPGEAAGHVLQILERCLDPDRDERPANGAELAQELSLCIQPRTQRLLRLPQRGWRERVRRWPILAVLLIVTLPNAIAGAFNYAYNSEAIINGVSDQALTAKLQEAFFPVMCTINAIAFPLGAFLVYVLVRPVGRLVRSPELVKRTSPATLAAMRRYALRLGHLAAVIGIVEWVVAGLIYPTAIHVRAGEMPASAYPHFLISLALCGLVAAAYPFFGVTFLAVRVFFPALLPRGTVDTPAEDQLRRLSQQAGMYFLIACGVPLVGVALLLMSGSAESAEQLRHVRHVTLALSLLSLGGLAVAFKTYGVILRDIEALLPVLRPADRFGIESSTKF